MIKFGFENLETGEQRIIEADLMHVRSEFMSFYQLYENGESIADGADTKREAVENGIWSFIPEMSWGWHPARIARIGIIQ